MNVADLVASARAAPGARRPSSTMASDEGAEGRVPVQRPTTTRTPRRRCRPRRSRRGTGAARPGSRYRRANGSGGWLERVGLRDLVHGVDDVAQVDDQPAVDRPQPRASGSLGPQPVDELVEPVAAPRRIDTGSAAAIARPASRSSTTYGSRKAGCQSPRLVQPVVDGLAPCCGSRRPPARAGAAGEPLPRVAQPAGGAARVHPGALPGLPDQRPGLVEVLVEVAGPVDPAADVLARCTRPRARPPCHRAARRSGRRGRSSPRSRSAPAAAARRARLTSRPVGDADAGVREARDTSIVVLVGEARW